MVLFILLTLMYISFKLTTWSGLDKKRRIWIGYRTPRSFKSQHNWDIAQNTYKNIFYKIYRLLFIIMLILTVADIYLLFSKYSNLVLKITSVSETLMFLIINIYLFFRTEYIIKKSDK